MSEQIITGFTFLIILWEYTIEFFRTGGAAHFINIILNLIIIFLLLGQQVQQYRAYKDSFEDEEE